MAGRRLMNNRMGTCRGADDIRIGQVAKPFRLFLFRRSSYLHIRCSKRLNPN